MRFLFYEQRPSACRVLPVFAHPPPPSLNSVLNSERCSPVVSYATHHFSVSSLLNQAETTAQDLGTLQEWMLLDELSAVSDTPQCSAFLPRPCVFRYVRPPTILFTNLNISNFERNDIMSFQTDDSLVQFWESKQKKEITPANFHLSEEQNSCVHFLPSQPKLASPSFTPVSYCAMSKSAIVSFAPTGISWDFPRPEISLKTLIGSIPSVVEDIPVSTDCSCISGSLPHISGVPGSRDQVWQPQRAQVLIEPFLPSAERKEYVKNPCNFHSCPKNTDSVILSQIFDKPIQAKWTTGYPIVEELLALPGEQEGCRRRFLMIKTNPPKLEISPLVQFQPPKADLVSTMPVFDLDTFFHAQRAKMKELSVDLHTLEEYKHPSVGLQLQEPHLVEAKHEKLLRLPRATVDFLDVSSDGRITIMESIPRSAFEVEVDERILSIASGDTRAEVQLHEARMIAVQRLLAESQSLRESQKLLIFFDVLCHDEVEQAFLQNVKKAVSLDSSTVSSATNLWRMLSQKQTIICLADCASLVLEYSSVLACLSGGTVTLMCPDSFARQVALGTLRTFLTESAYPNGESVFNVGAGSLVVCVQSATSLDFLMSSQCSCVCFLPGCETLFVDGYLPRLPQLPCKAVLWTQHVMTTHFTNNDERLQLLHAVSPNVGIQALPHAAFSVNCFPLPDTSQPMQGTLHRAYQKLFNDLVTQLLLMLQQTRIKELLLYIPRLKASVDKELSEALLADLDVVLEYHQGNALGRIALQALQLIELLDVVHTSLMVLKDGGIQLCAGWWMQMTVPVALQPAADLAIQMAAQQRDTEDTDFEEDRNVYIKIGAIASLVRTITSNGTRSCTAVLIAVQSPLDRCLAAFRSLESQFAPLEVRAVKEGEPLVSAVMTLMESGGSPLVVVWKLFDSREQFTHWSVRSLFAGMLTFRNLLPVTVFVSQQCADDPWENLATGYYPVSAFLPRSFTCTHGATITMTACNSGARSGAGQKQESVGWNSFIAALPSAQVNEVECVEKEVPKKQPSVAVEVVVEPTPQKLPPENGEKQPAILVTEQVLPRQGLISELNERRPSLELIERETTPHFPLSFAVSTACAGVFISREDWKNAMLSKIPHVSEDTTVHIIVEMESFYPSDLVQLGSDLVNVQSISHTVHYTFAQVERVNLVLRLLDEFGLFKGNSCLPSLCATQQFFAHHPSLHLIEADHIPRASSVLEVLQALRSSAPRCPGTQHVALTLFPSGS